MLVFTRLAELSHAKRQHDGRDRFLLLAGISACRTGCLDVAERCRSIVLGHNASHLIGRYVSLPDALRDPEFQPFVLMLNRFCSFEQGELLVEQNGGMRDAKGQSNLQVVDAALDRMDS